MTIRPLEADVEIISKLGTNPGIDDGLSEAQLKAKFDAAAKIIKDYINNYLILQIDSVVDVEALLKNILDATLSQSDKAANAASTGDAIRDLRAFFEEVVHSGDYVLEADGCFAAEAVGEAVVRVQGGKGVMLGNLFTLNLGEYEDVNLEDGTYGLFRNDLIVVRCSRAEDKSLSYAIVALTGAQTSGDPADPAYEQGDINADGDVRDFPLYRVKFNGLDIESVTPLFVKQKTLEEYIRDYVKEYFDEHFTTDTQITISVAGADGTSMEGRTVTVTNADDGSAIKEFKYSGQPETLTLPIATRIRITCDTVNGFVTPDPVECNAVAGSAKTVNIVYKLGTRYGFRRSKNNSSPAGRIEYLFDAVDKTPAAMGLNTGTFDFGDWEDFVYKVARPVMLKTNGTVDYELDPDNQTLRKDNGLSSDVSNTSYNGNAMVEFFGFKWVKRYEDASYEYVIFSDVQFDEDYHAYAHTGADGKVKDAFYWGMFKGTNVSSKLRSIGTGSVMVSQTRNTEVTYAMGNGDQYYTIYKSGWDYIADLLTLISKSDNSQAAFGSGRSLSSNSAAIAVGTLKDKGPFWGSSNGTSDVKVFWIEGFWGNVWEGMAGLILAGSAGIKVKMTPPYNFDGTDYEATNIVPSGTSGGYVNLASVSDKYGYVPKVASGSETTYMCDGLWFNNSQTDYALVGGSWNGAGLCGSRYVFLYALASRTNAYVGSRLSYLPE